MKVFPTSCAKISTIELTDFPFTFEEFEMDEMIYTTDDVANLLRLSRRKVEKMVVAKEFLQPFYLGDLPRWLKVDVLAWVET